MWYAIWRMSRMIIQTLKQRSGIICLGMGVEVGNQWETADFLGTITSGGG